MMPDVVAKAQLGTGRRHAQLPAEATGFVGRSEELAAITALLGPARLVTAIGPAGVGKTRLARRAAADVATRFTEGACFIDLSEVRDPGLLASEVAVALRLPGQEEAQARQPGAVLDYLRGRELLLILDTCEHLVDACAAFADSVLRAAPGVTVLATSRQPLDVPGEHTYPVPPLPVPDDVSADRDEAAADDAVELFAQRAAAVLPEFTVTPDNRASVVRLCRRLDGIPLAIELAAVRLRALPLPELADRVEHGFSVLTASRRGTTARHKTMRTAVEWSYELCTAAEQALWARLSVFAGSFDMAMAEQVCADESLPADEFFEALIGLVDKSVVLRDQRVSGRYRLLDTLREFGAEKLAEAGLEAVFADRLAARRVAGSAEFDEYPGNDEQAQACRKLGREQLKMQAALKYALGCAGPPQRSLAWAPVLAVPAGSGPAGSGPAGSAVAATGPAAIQAWSAPDLLTKRESQVAAMVASGLSNQQIASRLFISRRTVETHVEHVFAKLAVSSRVQLVVWLRDHGQTTACDQRVPATSECSRLADDSHEVGDAQRGGGVQDL
jgi:non-specific serine/threonine protein kinase